MLSSLPCVQLSIIPFPFHCTRRQTAALHITVAHTLRCCTHCTHSVTLCFCTSNTFKWNVFRYVFCHWLGFPLAVAFLNLYTLVQNVLFFGVKCVFFFSSTSAYTVCLPLLLVCHRCHAYALTLSVQQQVSAVFSILNRAVYGSGSYGISQANCELF